MPFQCDDSQWPLVVQRLSGESSLADVAAFIAANESALKRRQPHVVILDASHGKNILPEHRRMAGEWVLAHDAALRSYRKGAAWVISSPVVRGLVTAVYWFRKSHPYPVRFFSTYDEAKTWVMALL